MKKVFALVSFFVPMSVFAGAPITELPEPGMLGLLAVAGVALAINHFRKK